MKLIIVLALVGLAVARPDVFDGNDQAYDAAMENPRLLEGYADCILETRPCTIEGKKLKDVLPNVINNSCADCSEKNKKRVGTALVGLKENFIDKYEALKIKFDPEGKRVAELEAFEKQYGS